MQPKLSDKDASMIVKSSLTVMFLVASLFYCAYVAMQSEDFIRALTLTITGSVISIIYYVDMRRIVLKQK